MTAQIPPVGPCSRCGQARELFPPKRGWGRMPGLLCSRDWSRYADARAEGTYVDWADAFENATDEEFEAVVLGPTAEPHEPAR